MGVVMVHMSANLPIYPLLQNTMFLHMQQTVLEHPMVKSFRLPLLTIPILHLRHHLPSVLQAEQLQLYSLSMLPEVLILKTPPHLYK